MEAIPVPPIEVEEPAEETEEKEEKDENEDGEEELDEEGTAEVHKFLGDIDFNEDEDEVTNITLWCAFVNFISE